MCRLRIRREFLILKSIKDRTGVIKKNAGASLIDIGDGVACLEFHSKMNAIGGDTLQMLKFALGEVDKNFVGLVVGNQGANFCVGANIMLMLMEAQEENWDELDMMARVFQNATMSLRYSPKPVVVAPFQMVFGGGCEMVLHADRVRAAAETYIGLVEVGVGIIPAGGGTKEMLLRTMDSIPKGVDDADPFPFVKRAFETIALAKVATSAEEARALGFLSVDDTISMNADRLIADAKKEVLALAASGYVATAATQRYPRVGRARARDVETRHSPDEARRIYFGSRCRDWNAARADSDRRRLESSDACFRAVSVGSRARSVSEVGGYA